MDAALLLAEMAVPHPVRPAWPNVLRFAHSRLLPSERLLALDQRLESAAARPVVIPETIVVDRGKIFCSKTFNAACESLGISVQPAPPHAPTAKGIVERTFGSINTLFCQHLPGYTGSDVTRRGRTVEREACFTLTELQDLLDEWLVHYHHRPHDGLRHPVLPRTALPPHQMWGALVSVAGYVPVPLTRDDYLELLPVRWQAITEHGIRINHRTYDHDVLAPYRGQPSPHAGRGGKWEIHTHPHDIRQIWLRLPDHTFAEIPWIHRDHLHRPFNEQTFHHVRSHLTPHGDPDQHQADLADALDQLMRRARTGHAIPAETRLITRIPNARTPLPPPRPDTGSLDHTDVDPDPDPGADCGPGADAEEGEEHGAGGAAGMPYTGLGLYDAEAEALKW
ncbi:Mu transposase C-terminal domain-containing protein [Streptomyces sp. NBC_00568]|uniref:Mu transposase C-terminal domain-containing protein n=1 Tax=Streptomyces sp. NBC_00568 TaxID=2975779 RepID=UPI002B1D6121|nr:Mu transposase C-terminal domain-containing protein [Streptomyces sp. NBC_00568]